MASEARAKAALLDASPDAWARAPSARAAGRASSPAHGPERDWRTESALWAALGRPQEAAAALQTAPSGPDRAAAALIAGRGWLKAGDKTQAAAQARAELASAADA